MEMSLSLDSLESEIEKIKIMIKSPNKFKKRKYKSF